MKEIIRLNEEQLRKMVNESIKKKIMETMGINDEMESESSSLVHFIQKNIRKAPIEYDEDLNQNYHILNYDHQFENKKFHWTIIGYIYPDDDNFKDNHDVQISEGRSSSNGRDIFFGWIYFSMTEDGWFNFAEVSDSVYHEMLHLLKTKKAKKYTGNLNFINASNKQYNTTEGIEKDIAVICYMSREDEQDAFINGLYGILKEEFLYHQNINVVQIFNKSPLGQKIKEIKPSFPQLVGEVTVFVCFLYYRVVESIVQSSSSFLASTYCAMPAATFFDSFIAKTTVAGPCTTSPLLKTPARVVMP